MIAAVAEIARNPGPVIGELRRRIDEAKAEREAANEAISKARDEREAADRKLKELEVADRNLREQTERVTKELNQRRSDITENEAIIAQREHIVSEREVAEEGGDEKGRLQARRVAVRTI
jgi:chromosome segregation ATPase